MLMLSRSSSLGRVIVKGSSENRLDNERNIVNHFAGRKGTRQLLDETRSSPSLVLWYLDDNLLSPSDSKRLERSYIKLVAKSILMALQTLHEEGYVHTGIVVSLSLRIWATINLTVPIVDLKPDNVLADYEIGACRFKEAVFGDYGETCLVNPNDHLKPCENGHMIGAHMFRSPKAMLNFRWGTPTDIWWSFGTTVGASVCWFEARP